MRLMQLELSSSVSLEKIWRAQSWIDQVLVAWKATPSRLPQALARAASLAMDNTTLAATGAGLVLNSRIVWQSLDQQAQARRLRLVAVWKHRELQKPAEKDTKRSHPFKNNSADLVCAV